MMRDAWCMIDIRTGSEICEVEDATLLSCHYPHIRPELLRMNPVELLLNVIFGRDRTSMLIATGISIRSTFSLTRRLKDVRLELPRAITSLASCLRPTRFCYIYEVTKVKVIHRNIVRSSHHQMHPRIITCLDKPQYNKLINTAVRKWQRASQANCSELRSSLPALCACLQRR